MAIKHDRWREISDRLPQEVNLLAVSKGHSVASIRKLAELGQTDFGESRLQEALPKLESLSDLKHLRWHFIGRLQTNKVRGVVRAFEVIHSVDSYSLAERISRISGDELRCPKIMVQVKLREDHNKGGMLKDYLLEEWPKFLCLPHLKIIGLMTMAPLNISLEERKYLFRECRRLADSLALPDCSMGMSSDWEEALEAGSTWLRLGSALFGKRLKG